MDLLAEEQLETLVFLVFLFQEYGLWPKVFTQIVKKFIRRMHVSTSQPINPHTGNTDSLNICHNCIDGIYGTAVIQPL